jgi:feruloyl esterase
MAAAVIMVLGVLAGTAAARPAGTASRAAAPAGQAVLTGVQQPIAAHATQTACSAEAIQATVTLPHVSVVSATPVTGGSYTPPGTTTPIRNLPPFCAVALTDPDAAGNVIGITAWLPTAWNGRFEGAGGAGYVCGPLFSELAAGIQGGYATAATNCGITTSDGSFALTSDGRLNWPLIDDFAYAGIHDMSVAGKAVTTGFYASKPRYSYFNGCSTGGREGLMEAQRYPADYNGIVSGAPAINWTRFIPAEIWPELVMKQSGDYLPACKENAFTAAVVKACDSLDKVTDGIIDPTRCHWDPMNLVGTSTPCGTITKTDAQVVAKIWEGPVTADGKHLWYGLEPGASFAGLAGTATVNGATTPTPFPIAVTWLGTWLQRTSSWNWQTLTYAQFDRLFEQSVSEFADVIATDNPELSRFEQDGGKILIWHGLADQLIFPQGSINYYQRVENAMGGARRTGTFARLFLAPGAQHCASAAGPAPANPLAAVVNWVEHGQPPVSILGTVVNPATGTVTLSRPLCMYPLVARYTGHGSTNDAANFTCARSY